MRRIIPCLVVAGFALPATAHASNTALPDGHHSLGRPSAAASVATPSRPLRQIATVVIPRLKLRAPLFVGNTDAIFDVGLGQWPGTPGPGKPGNLVIGGHRTGGKMPFINIAKMMKGDSIKITVGKKTYVYKVTSKKIIKPSNLSILTPTEKATLTLYTCHPPHSVKMRYVVRASLTT